MTTTNKRNKLGQEPIMQNPLTEDDAREFADSHSEDELPDDYEPTYDDYYGAAHEKFMNDDCEYDLI